MKIAQEALPFVAVLGISMLAVGVLTHVALAAPFALLLLFTLWFFRDPERRTPDDPHAVISPADGKILRADKNEISVFMNVFDVHVCRAPIAADVAAVDHRSGRFLAAYKDAASDHNERVSIELRDGQRKLTFTLVAGLIARRIVCRVTPGQRLSAGERIGLIRFGSRVDVVLPPGSTPQVRPGQRVVAGVTILARLVGGSRGAGPDRETAVAGSHHA
jgi:phosphatidylserine decarboxylase